MENMKNIELLPIKIIKYDPVNQEIVKESIHPDLLPIKGPTFYETSYVFNPYIPISEDL